VLAQDVGDERLAVLVGPFGGGAGEDASEASARSRCRAAEGRALKS
jgi:hypothetical protein